MDPRALEALNAGVQPMGILDQKRLLRAMFYADTGVGKTSLAAHLVENKGIAVTSDSAWSVVGRYPEIASKWDRVPFMGFSQIRSIAEAHSEGIDKWCEYDTLLWDPTSASVKSMLRANATKNGRPVEEWPDYNVVEKYLTDTIEALNKSKLNVIYTAHIRFPNDKGDAEKGLYAVRPNMPEACYNVVAREVQLIGYMFRNDVGERRKIQFEPTKRITAKTQIPTIAEGVYDANKVPAMIREWKNGRV